MSQELTIATPKMAEVSPQYGEILMLGNVLHQSGYFKDVRDQAQAVTKILFGRELGFSPIVSISGIHIIEGKPALSSNLMATLIKRSGKYDYRVTRWDNTGCVLMFRQKEAGKWEEVGESSFTMDDARAAGVIRAGGSWAKYPKAMLFARALSQGLRTYCPDVSASPIYNPEEMGAEVNEEGEVTQLPKSARPVERTTEDIPIGSPGTKPAAESKGRITDPPQAPESIEPLPPLDDLVKQAEANLAPKPAELPHDRIGDPQAVNFHRVFKEALKPGLRKKEAELSHAWLKQQGIVDGNGDPTAKAILKDNFYEVREEAVRYASGLV